MEPITVIMLILAAALLIGSCFLPAKTTGEVDEDKLLLKLAKRELTPEETERIRQKVDEIISQKTEEVILKTDDHLSTVANEKIISVDEYSKQIMERLDKNNSDATFLYHMISDTKEELKNEIAEARNTEHALRSLSQQVQTAKKEASVEKPEMQQAKQTVKDVKKNETDIKSSLQPEKKKNESVPVNKKGKAKAPEKSAPSAKEPVDDIAELLKAVSSQEEMKEDAGRDIQKEKILELHKKGWSIREISRELSMGQGEVKLVIDLYAD